MSALVALSVAADVYQPEPYSPYKPAPYKPAYKPAYKDSYDYSVSIDLMMTFLLK